MHIHIYAYTCKCTYTYTCTYICKYTYTHIGSDAAQPLDAARRDLRNFSSGHPSAVELLQSHERAWAALRESRIELGGSGGVGTAIATAVNSSMFYLLSAARVDWPYSTSPGGIANNAYLGYACWSDGSCVLTACASLVSSLGRFTRVFACLLQPHILGLRNMAGWSGV